jgi:hypothetical protein
MHPPSHRLAEKSVVHILCLWYPRFWTSVPGVSYGEGQKISVVEVAGVGWSLGVGEKVLRGIAPSNIELELGFMD